MQPTTVCNLNCSYCYLPDRRLIRRMSPSVSHAVASSIANVPRPVRILWHGGEPLACGVEWMRGLLQPFGPGFASGRVTFGVQTNATLIDDDWCELFNTFRFDVGVSIDGPAAHNAARRNWAGREAFPDVMRGIERLKANGIPFGVIAVVNRNNIHQPEEWYSFFCELGCSSLNVNIEEREGLNKNAAGLPDEAVASFWRRLFAVWRERPVLRVREFDRMLAWLSAGPNAEIRGPRDVWPTVSFDGDVIILAPELAGADASTRRQFVVGNVLERALGEIVADASTTAYVADFWAGVGDCREQCAYFSYCGGGHASNKFFELGSTRGTETEYCRHSYKLVVDNVIESLSGQTEPQLIGGRT